MTDIKRLNKPKLRSSPVIKALRERTMCDKQFYTELIRQCEIVLPLVNKYDGICDIIRDETKFRFSTPLLKKTVVIIAVHKPRFEGSAYYGSVNDADRNHRYTPAWKQDRVELLNEIVNYCKSKL